MPRGEANIRGIGVNQLNVVLVSVDNIFSNDASIVRWLLMLQEILEETLTVKEQGGVSVGRDGNGKMEHWQYGYRYITNILRDSITLLLEFSPRRPAKISIPHSQWEGERQKIIKQGS